MGIEGPDTPAYLRTLGISVLVGGLCVGMSRVFLDAAKLWARLFIRRWHLHHEVALFIGASIMVVVLIMLINGVLYRGFLAGASMVFQPQNSATRDGVTQPTAPQRS